MVPLTLVAGPSAGTQTIWSSLMMIPNSVLNAATGIPESTFTEFKKYPLVIAPGTGGEACLAKCNITFQAVRASTANPQPLWHRLAPHPVRMCQVCSFPLQNYNCPR